jgi:multiple sugar transport system substrate-binding protein
LPSEIEQVIPGFDCDRTAVYAFQNAMLLKPAEIDQIARDFEAQNPDIKVNMEYVSYDNLHDKIVTGMAAKPPAYDAVMVDVIWPDEFIKAGYLLDVTNRITPDMKSGMFPASWISP